MKSYLRERRSKRGKISNQKGKEMIGTRNKERVVSKMGNKVNKGIGGSTKGSEALSEWSVRQVKSGGGTRGAEDERRGHQARKASGYSKGEVQASERWSEDRKASRDHPAI